jgi:hypothetical protein
LVLVSTTAAASSSSAFATPAPHSNTAAATTIAKSIDMDLLLPRRQGYTFSMGRGNSRGRAKGVS